MKKAILLVVAALVIPTSVAMASKPSKGPKHPHQVTYVLKGTLSGFTAYNAESSTNGSISILVKSGDHHAKSLKGQTLTFAVDKNTKVKFHDGATTIPDGDKGIVKVRAADHVPADQLAATLQAQPAKHVIDRGLQKPKH